jgi:transposase-like protein
MFCYRCDDCGSVFEEWDEYREEHGEEFINCPACKSSYFTIVEECIFCGAYTLQLEEGLCPSCAAGLKENFDDFLLDNFSAKEIRALRSFGKIS